MGNPLEDNVRRLIELIKLDLDPYRKYYKYDVNSTARELKKKYSYLKEGEETEDYFRIGGRVMSIRAHGKIMFIDVLDDTDKIQVVVREDVVGKEKFKVIKKFLNKGDIVGIFGNVFKTKRGELSLLAKDINILSLCFRDIPDEWYGLRDVEKRYTERYLDFILNEKAREAVITVYKIERSFRNYLDKLGFIEVHTPKLQKVYGGALARPFVTEMWYTGEKLYLSISPETYLKRLVVGQFYKVYEISTCFRNESVDSTHNPEFVQIEIYWAFADWEKMMELTENLISNAVKEIFGNYDVEVGDKRICYKPPFKRISLEEAIKEELNIDLSSMDEEEIVQFAKKDLGIEIDENERIGKIIEEIFEKYVQPKIINPTFVTLYRRDVSPLARVYRYDERYVERFELFINGVEVGNGYSEQNNPFLQYKAFKDEEELRKRVRKEGLEYMPMDKDYVRALEYGLPPTGGVGIGIQRLAMVLLGLNSIKEVIPFPFVKIDLESIVNLGDLYKEVIDYYVSGEKDKFLT